MQAAAASATDEDSGESSPASLASALRRKLSDAEEHQKSVAAQLKVTLDGLDENFEAFHEDLKKAEPSELKDFVARGIENLKWVTKQEELGNNVLGENVQD